MNAHARDDGRATLSLALLRATLVAVILVSEQLIQARRLADAGFFWVLALAAVYSVAGIAMALGPREGHGARALAYLQPGLDVAFLAGLACTSGGAFSDVRKAFFVVPLAAAFSERPRSTANWSLFAVAAFTAQAFIARGRPQGSANSWVQMTLNQDLYLAWTGAAATMLATALRRRTARTEELSRSRQRLVTHAIAAVERERTRLAGALHDAPLQNLMAARHDLRRAERSADPDSFARLHDAIDLTIAQLREEIFNLHPHVLDHVGLSAALEQVAARHRGERDVQVNIEIDHDASVARREILFALGRELLCNAIRHAHARQVRLAVTRRAGSVTLEVADDGVGIAEGRVREALLDGHIGLSAVKERAEALNGSLQIDTAPGAGTRIRVTLPLEVQAPARRPDISVRVTALDALQVSTT